MEKIFKIDGYVLTSYEDEGRYTISFIDVTNEKVEKEITKDIYEEYKKAYLEYESQRNKSRKHVEYSELSENILYNKTSYNFFDVAEIVENKLLAEEIERVIATFTATQKRRFKMYYYEGLTYREIAQIEGCCISSVQESISFAKKIFKKFFKLYP